MAATLRLPCLVALAAASALAACEARNPAQISRARHPELYHDADQAAAAAARVVAAAPVVAPADEPRPAPDFSDVGGKTVVVEAAVVENPATPLDLAAALDTGALRIDVNDPTFAGRLGPLFDGDTTTLERSEDVNPLILVLHFQPPVRVSAVRVFPSYSTYDWAVRPQPDQPRYLVRGAAEEAWSRIDLPAPLRTAEVRIELRRLVRDNFVHLNEVELIPASSGNAE